MILLNILDLFFPLLRGSAILCCIGDISIISSQWERPISKGFPAGNSSIDRNQISHMLTTLVRFRNLSKLMAIASGVSATNYGEIASFLSYFFTSSTRHSLNAPAKLHELWLKQRKLRQGSDCRGHTDYKFHMELSHLQNPTF
jgi:hypothetical protein